MPQPMTAHDARAILEPAVAAMLSEDEQRTLVIALLADDGQELHRDDLLPVMGASVQWDVRGERGMSYLGFEDGPDALVAHVQSDLQDFIAESRFGWGERRFPRPAP